MKRPNARSRKPGEVPPQRLTKVDRSATGELSAFEQRFVDEFVLDLNAAAAYRRARDGKPLKGAKQLGSRTLESSAVRERVQQRLAELHIKAGITAESILGELGYLAHVDIGDLFDGNNCLKPVASLPENLRRAIASIEVDEIIEGRGAERRVVGHTRKIRFWDKPGALDLLGRHRKLFTDKIEHSGRIDLADLLAASWEHTASKGKT